jgi:hypothetical protein
LSTAIQGDIAVVGAPQRYEPSFYEGATYVFGRNVRGANNWGLLKKLSTPTNNWSRQLGADLAIDGQTIAVGAPTDFSNGAVYLFDRDIGGTNNWGYSKTVAINTGLNSLFGDDVATSGNTLIARGNRLVHGAVQLGRRLHLRSQCGRR